MDFYNGFKRELLGQVKVDTLRYKNIEQSPAQTSEDMLMFYESMFKRHHSDWALNEYSRVNHMLFKTALDGVP